MRVASFFPFQTSYYLNGHSFIEQELKRGQIGFRKSDNACQPREWAKCGLRIVVAWLSAMGLGDPTPHVST
jgi:hypothetical protein